jgi:anti-sigma-K factor RskA
LRASRPPASSGAHEIKHDGYRFVARRDRERMRTPTERARIWRWPVLAAALLVNSACTKEPIRMACSGDMYRVQSASTDKQVPLSLSIDLHAGTVTVSMAQRFSDGGRNLEFPSVPISGNPQSDTLIFSGKLGGVEFGVVQGSVNRTTGDAFITMITPLGLYDFSGICKAAQRLF